MIRSKRSYRFFLLILVMAIGCKTNSDELQLKGDYFSQKPPGLEPELFAPWIISTGHHEHSGPVYSPDKKHLFYTIADNSQHVILYRNQISGVWSDAAVAPFSGNYSDDRPFFSLDGQRIYFESNRPIAEKEFNRNAWNWWYSDLKDNGWSEPKIETYFSSLVMSTPALSENGNLYFSSTERGGFGRADLFVVKSVNGKFEEPINLGESINSASMEAYLWIAPDESYLLFSSFGREEGSGLYITFHNEDGTWTPAKYMGKTINAEGDERFVKVSPDNKYLFFNSQRNDHGEFSEIALTMQDLNRRLNSPCNAQNLGDIYWVDATVIDSFR